MLCVVLRNCALLALAIDVSLGGLAAAADAPLHAQIDKLIEAKAGGPLAEPASDAEFLRRVYLDLAGRLPSVEETRAFLADPAADKREKLIDQLLAQRRPRAADDAGLSRDADGAAGRPRGVAEVPQESFEANKPWDQMVREMLEPGFRRRSQPRLGPVVHQAAGELRPEPGRYSGPGARRGPALPGHRRAVRPVPRPPVRRRLQAGVLSRPVCLRRQHDDPHRT